MKKFRVILFAVAITTAIGSAYAAKMGPYCESFQQYRYANGMYTPVGEFGVTYVCWQVGGWCTYYKPNYSSPYIPCRTGMFIPIW
jgi:hypothetical protein